MPNISLGHPYMLRQLGPGPAIGTRQIIYPVLIALILKQHAFNRIRTVRITPCAKTFEFGREEANFNADIPGLS